MELLALTEQVEMTVTPSESVRSQAYSREKLVVEEIWDHKIINSCENIVSIFTNI